MTAYCRFFFNKHLFDFFIKALMKILVFFALSSILTTSLVLRTTYSLADNERLGPFRLLFSLFCRVSQLARVLKL